MQLSKNLLVYIAAMCAVVALSNFLVQFPVHLSLGALNLADLLTWGAFTYPIAFLVTDLVNRNYGPAQARMIVFAGFFLAVILSIILATPRIAIASGTAFLLAQLLDVSVFDKLRKASWWLPPLVSSFLGSTLDTAIFFTLAFAPSMSFLGANDAFAIETAPMLGFLAFEIPRWISWAIGDYGVKLLVALTMLIPYGVLLKLFAAPKTA